MIKVVDTDQGLRAFREELRRGPRKVNVGQLPSVADRPHGDTGVTLLQVAIANEFGAPAGEGGKWVTPERSWLRSTFDRRQKTLLSFMHAEAKRQARRGLQNFRMDLLLRKVGAFALFNILERIRKGIPPPNAEITVYRKKSSTPLIDTGQFWSSLSYEVQKR